MRRLTVFVCALALLTAGVASAQVTSGRLTGQISDNEGKALPGVTVTISSDNLIGGAQTAVTGAEGGFAFNLLPPGMYDIATALPGFTPAAMQARVNISRTTEVRIQMVLSQFAEEIQVVAEAPVVDTSQVDTGQVFDETYLQNAAIGMGGRDYLSIIGQAAGVAGSGNVNVYGSTFTENNYLVDGLTTTDPVTATFGTNFNYDAIQEVNFLTGGFEAEFGQATGGIVNLVTKSGGNEFSGTLDMRYRDESFAESGDHYDPNNNISSLRDISATLGGPIIRDKVWFFVSAENVVSKATPPFSDSLGLPESFWFQPGTRKYEGWNYIGKATWQATDANRVVFKFSGDPADIDYASTSVYRKPEADRFQTQGGNIYQAELDSVLSDNMLFTGAVGINRSSLDSYPENGSIEMPGHYNYDTQLYTENYMNAQYSTRDRDTARGSLTYFIDDLAGSHEFKGGVEYNKINFSSRNFRTGDRSFYDWQADYTFDGVPDTYDGNGDGITDYIMYQGYPFENARLAKKSEGKLWTAFIQDAWRPTPNITIKPGIRYDTVAFDNNFGDQVADMGKVQPRLGVAWDVTGNGKHVVRANWGRFMHPTALTIPNFVSGLAQGTARYIGYEYWCNAGYCDPDFLTSAFGDPYTYTDQYGYDHMYFPYDAYGYEPAQTWDTLGVGSINAPYADEFILGYETELFTNTSIEVNYINKNSKDLLEDTCNDNSWTWGDGTPASLDDPSTWTNLDNCSTFVLGNLPGLKRDYRAYVVKFESRARDWFHIIASYTWSKSQGNTEADATYGYATGGYDVYPIDFFHMYGFTSDHRRHRIKMNGYFLLPYDITVGFDAFWSSPGHYTVTADCGDVQSASPDELAAAGIDPAWVDYCYPGGGYTLNVTPRGAATTNSNYQLDLQASKAFKVRDISLEAIFTIINAFSNERPVSFQSTALTNTPVGTPLDWQNPRRYELGLRLEF